MNLNLKNGEPVNGGLLADMIRSRPEVPDGKRGKVSITSKVIAEGEKIDVVSLRNAIFMGERPTSVVLDAPIRVRCLKYENGVWMQDIPQEIWQMRHAIKAARGRVLVGGLGLGVISSLIMKLSPNVDTVTTVEKDKRIVHLVAPTLRAESIYHNILTDCLFKHLQSPVSYDYAFLDIWQGTGETEWKEYIVPLRRLARGKVTHVDCWNEKEMQGQLRMGLPPYGTADDTVDYGKFGFYQEVFRQACRRAGVRPTWGKDTPINQLFIKHCVAHKNKQLARLLELYLQPGTDAWERKFGELWDSLCPSTCLASRATAGQKLVHTDTQRKRKSK